MNARRIVRTVAAFLAVWLTVAWCARDAWPQSPTQSTRRAARPAGRPRTSKPAPTPENRKPPAAVKKPSPSTPPVGRVPVTTRNPSTVRNRSTTRETGSGAKESTSARGPAKPKTKTDDPQQVRAASFQGITPGLSSKDDVIAKLGQPGNADDESVSVYEVEPFSSVDIVFAKNKVHSIVIYMAEQVAAEEIAAELNLGRFRPLDLLDDEGELLGRAYPERGVVLSFDPEAEQMVGQILLETISAEPFLLRVHQDRAVSYTQQLFDLKQVQRIDPSIAEAYWMEAEIDAAIGHYANAVVAAKKAVELEADNVEYQLSYGYMLGKAEDYAQGIKVTRAVTQLADLSQLDKARAEEQLADLLAAQPSHDYKQSVERRMSAIQIAKPLLRDSDPDVRRAASRLVIESHLEIATDIARGNWRRKPEVVPKWIAKANEVADVYFEMEKGDPIFELLTLSKTVKAYHALKGQLDIKAVIDDATRTANRLVSEASDDHFKRQLRWSYGEMLMMAAETEKAAGDLATALRHASSAAAMIEQTSRYRGESPERDYLVGRSCFLVGALQAIHKRDHRKAVLWFNKAIPMFESPLPKTHGNDLAMQGDRLVSMGVSYWQIGQRRKAVEVTQLGVEMVEEAVADGLAPESSLAVPFSNLASMNRELGNVLEAQRFAEESARVESEAATIRR